MNFKSQKGYSLIEIGIGILIITVFLVCSTAIFNGCFNMYRAIQQKNYVIKYALSRVENFLQSDIDMTLPDEIEVDGEIIGLEEAVSTLNGEGEEGKNKLLDGQYLVPEDKIEGAFLNSPATNNMVITTKIRRVPTDGTRAYDNSVATIKVIVQYTATPPKINEVVSADKILTYEIGAVKVTKK